MPLTPYQIKDDLLSNLDSSYNVVNTPGALAVVSKLETYPISTKDLQDTRLGRIINDMRKRTKSQELSKRAKNLLRQWQRLVPSDGEGPPGTAQSAPVPPAAPSNGVHTAKPSKLQQQNGKNSEGLVRPVSAAALLQRAESNSASSAAPVSVSRLSRPLSPAVSESSHKSGGRSRKRKDREDDRTPSSKRHAPSSALVDHVSAPSPLVNGLHVSTSSPALSSNSRAKVKTTAELIAQLQRSSSNASVGSEVIRKLSSHQIERESAEPESILPEAIRKRKYHKKDSVTPALPESTPSQLHRTKKERLATFVQESREAVTPRREGDELDGASSNVALAEEFMDGAPLTFGAFFPDSASIADSGPIVSLHSEENSRLGPAEPPPPVIQPGPGSEHSNVTEPFADGDGEEVVAVVSRVGPVMDGGGEKAEVRSDSPAAAQPEAGGEPAAFNVEDKIVDVYAQLPPLGDPLSLTSETSYLASMSPHRDPAAVSAPDVDKFHNTEWSGVNGCEGFRGAWSSWGDGVSQESYDGEMLHFLPYVDLPSTDALPKYSWDDSIKDLFDA